MKKKSIRINKTIPPKKYQGSPHLQGLKVIRGGVKRTGGGRGRTIPLRFLS
jgi:hypothetical protein